MWFVQVWSLVAAAHPPTGGHAGMPGGGENAGGVMLVGLLRTWPVVEIVSPVPDRHWTSVWPPLWVIWGALACGPKTRLPACDGVR